MARTGMCAGEHTRSIAISTPSLASAGIMRFAKKKVSCLGCRQPLTDVEGILCEHCDEKARAPCQLPCKPSILHMAVAQTCAAD